MALTPGGLPYPLGTDKVVDGDNAIRALAEATEARIGIKSKTTLVPLAGWSSGAPCTLFVRGGWAMLNARVDGAANAGDNMFQLPAAAIPSEQIVGIAMNGGNSHYTLIILTSGIMTLYGHGAAAVADLRLATMPPWPITLP